VAAPGDNVATALANFSAGDEVPVMTSEGVTMSRIVLRGDVIKFFKVAVADIPDEGTVRKFGEAIGQAVARSYAPKPSAANFFKVAAGAPVHLTNFIPCERLLEQWGGWERAASTVVRAHLKGQSRHYPYELGEVNRNFGAGQEIRLRDLHMDERLGNMLFPRNRDAVVGQSICPVAEGSPLRLGCCVGGSYLYPGQEAMIENIRRTYRFLKGRIYEIG
jgi:hypothetical protein